MHDNIQESYKLSSLKELEIIISRHTTEHKSWYDQLSLQIIKHLPTEAISRKTAINKGQYQATCERTQVSSDVDGRPGRILFTTLQVHLNLFTSSKIMALVDDCFPNFLWYS
ncbi:hypothetical protein TNCV_4613061 [Trichonephila clavipes]|nr:hypothetical protein TNCV_4613061 [Trichonephila clavipes]